MHGVVLARFFLGFFFLEAADERQLHLAHWLLTRPFAVTCRGRSQRGREHTVRRVEGRRFRTTSCVWRSLMASSSCLPGGWLSAHMGPDRVCSLLTAVAGTDCETSTVVAMLWSRLDATMAKVSVMVGIMVGMRHCLVNG